MGSDAGCAVGTPGAADPRASGNAWTRRLWVRHGAGLEFDRLAFFSDAVFAIAITLVAVEIGVPEIEDAADAAGLWAAFRADLPTIGAFFVAFAIVASYWLANHRFMASLHGFTAGFATLTMVYLASVAFLPYPAAVFGRYPDNPVAVALIAVAGSVVSSLEALLFYAAYRARLFTTPISRSALRWSLLGSLTPVGVFLLSIPVAFLAGPLVGVACWLLNALLGAIENRYTPAEMRPARLERPA